MKEPPQQLSIMDKARKAAAEAVRWEDGAANPDGTANAAIDAFLSALKEEGMVVVPREATEAMLAAYGACASDDQFEGGWKEAAQTYYAAMIAASEGETK